MATCLVYISTVFSVIALLMNTCNGLQCYECDGSQEEFCNLEDIELDTSALNKTDCGNEPEMTCWKIKTLRVDLDPMKNVKVDAMTLISRACGNLTAADERLGCNRLEGRGTFTYWCYCDTDLCNSAPSGIIHLYALLMLAMAVLSGLYVANGNT